MLDLTDKTIALLKGGPGSERAVSLKTAESVAAALGSVGAKVVTGPDFELPADTFVAMNLIHGTFGEDGQLQALLEARNIPYTGAGIEESRIAFDKALTKQRFIAAGAPTPRSQEMRLDGSESLQLSLPVVVKPPREGSSVGVHICRTQAEFEAAITDAKQFGSTTLIEEFIEGKELTVGMLGDRVLPIIHIEPVSGWYDIANKYPWMEQRPADAPPRTLYHCPAPFDAATTERIQAAAKAAYQSVGNAIYGRVDVMLRESDQMPFVLEVNTIPGMTSSSLLPKAANAVGISFPELCVRIIELSLAERAKKAQP
jgi:D-alanine-D-alanine ligase